MGTEKRTLIAIILSIIILVGYQFLFPTPPEKQPATEQAKEEKKENKPQEPVKPVSVPASKPAVSQAEEKEVRIETGLYSATLSSIGGTIKKWELKKYKDKDGLPVVLQQGQSIYQPLSIGYQNDFNLAKVSFRLSGKDLKLNENTSTGAIVFEYATSESSIRRTYTFYNDSYKVDLKDEVAGLPEYWITTGTDFGIYDKKDTSVHLGPVLLKDAERIEFDAKKLSETKSYQGRLKWIAQEDKYFFSAIVPVTQMDEAQAWKVQDASVIAFKGKSGINNFIVYAGPKEHDNLKKLDVGLEHIIDFGFFSIISRPLFWLMKFFHNFMGNYGWAIVLLTIVTRIPFIPLLNKSQASMRKMQEIQPKMAEIKEKYKKDPQKIQKETMELYKKHKVNPLGGCLPMLLQIPVFFALYKILSIAIELRGAPFILWITDLSGPDTLFGHIPSSFPLIGGFALGPLPIAMGITMVIQQKMTPSSADPAQQKMMMLMPVIFTFMFLNFASGLVLYWLINNLLSIAQQFYVNRKLAKEKAE
ncbi:MAG: membrane protein insertase YidC [Nitrospirae bacterium]|nr:membrane protein insertase YidC [Nitrospirota bacterium]